MSGRAEIVLQVWRSADGNWGGRLLWDGMEHGRVDGCPSAEDVECQAIEGGFDYQRVEQLDCEPPPNQLPAKE